MKRSRQEDEAKATLGQPAADTASGSTKKAKEMGTAFGDQLARMVDNPLCADVELLVGEEAAPVYASKVILMARSPVFEALLCGNFREAQPLAPSTSSSSPSSSSITTSPSLQAPSSLAPVFWHRAEIRGMEPRTMRHLLHCLYTDQLHPDLITSSEAASAQAPTNNEDATMTQQEQDLVALYAAADRYLVDMAKSLAKAELVRHFDGDKGDNTNVLAAFDLALAVAPELAKTVFQPLIESGASLFLGNDIKSMEAQWLGLSEDAAARIVGMHLEGIAEIEVFEAIKRRYRHHLAEAKEPGDDADDWAEEEDDDDDGSGGTDNDKDDGGKREKNEEMRRKKRKAREEAKKKVVGLIRGIKTSLLSVHELCKYVEPSGLFTDAQLLAAYRHAARTQHYVIEDLASSASHNFGDVQAHGKIRWSLSVQRTNAAEQGYEVHLRIEPGRNTCRLPDLSAQAVAITVLCDRRSVRFFWGKATTVVTVPGVLCVPFTARPNSGRVTIIVRVPPTAFTVAAH